MSNKRNPSSMRRNARIGALRRWCPACGRKAALSTYGVCRYCNARHPMDATSRRDRYLKAQAANDAGKE